MFPVGPVVCSAVPRVWYGNRSGNFGRVVIFKPDNGVQIQSHYVKAPPSELCGNALV